ncbi:hypothetical protein E2C01_054116 [Portunus trituberculatus]|uniref:Uncharacterized protein n=1 Tax=Portunus trituberculatus TaxID=210409 RepID=A0A5B7GIF2_PORTR|nr:hypothetical protein [Portunus trituberculatus]
MLPEKDISQDLGHDIIKMWQTVNGKSFLYFNDFFFHPTSNTTRGHQHKLVHVRTNL